MSPETAAIYVWQMFDGRWHVSPIYRNQQQATETAMLLWRDGFDGGANTQTEIIARLKAKGYQTGAAIGAAPQRLVGLLVKLGSIAVHAEEAASADGHAFDHAAIASALADPEVRAFLDHPDNRALLPLKRRP